MARRLKLLTGLSTIALTGALALSACGGEGEGAALIDVAHDKSAFLSALQIVRGHLRAGEELYESGDREMGAQHMRHPQAEILTSLAPAFGAFNAMNFEPAIDALASAGEAGSPPAEVSALHAEAVRSINAASNAAGASVKERLLAVARTLTVAADEYSVAVKDGAIVNLHEYHDAYGFIATAIGDLEAMEGATDAEKAGIAAVLEQAKIAGTAAPKVMPPADLKPASVIYGAAARIEIVARGL